MEFAFPQDYDQKRKLFRTNSFVLAHSSAKKIYNEQLTLKNSHFHISLFREILSLIFLKTINVNKAKVWD